MTGAAPGSFLALATLTAPLFLLVLVGYALSRWGRWPKAGSDALTRFVFAVAIPALLFRLMSDFSRLPPVDARLLLAYFGGCVVTFVVARVVAAKAFGMDGASQSIFGVGTIFSNTVLLGIPLAKVTLGDAALPSVSLVIVFNSLLLWTLVTVSVEWARNRDLSARGLGRTALERRHEPGRRRHPARDGVRLHRPAAARLRRRHAGPHEPGRRADVADRARHGTRGVRDQRRLAGERGARGAEARAVPRSSSTRWRSRSRCRCAKRRRS